MKDEMDAVHPQSGGDPKVTLLEKALRSADNNWSCPVCDVGMDQMCRFLS
jgi:hypothetical protein